MKLQNHFTTIEQSERLLELGVPKNTADCYYDDGLIHIVQMEEEIDIIDSLFPCWSVGRLIEIQGLCVTEDADNVKDYIKDDLTPIENMMYSFELLAERGYIDFSKLEEK